MSGRVIDGVPAVDPNLSAKGALTIPTDYRKILEDIEQTLEHARGIGFGYKVVDSEKFYDLLNRLEAALPEDIRRASQVKQQAETELNNARQQASRIIEEARAQGGRIVDEARQKAQALASEHEITRLAEQRAGDTTRSAEDHAAQIKQEAEQYANEMRLQADNYEHDVRTDADNYAHQILERLDLVITRAKDSVDAGLAEIVHASSLE
jgi:F0F1-type ATP synthase membrane subunit b/b'